MFNFLQLVRNENMKIYRRPRTWVMYGIIVLLLLGISVIAKFVGTGDPNNWSMMQLESSILLSIITIFTVVASADSVAGEFSSGTIKLLLIRPWSRSKILLSKYVSLLLFALLMTIVLFLLSLFVNIFLFGYDGSSDAVSRVLGVNRDLPPLAYMLLYYVYQSVALVITVTLSFMLSTIFRSGGLAIGLSLFVLLAGGTITGLLSMLDYSWIKYILFINMNLTQYLNQTPTIQGMTLGFSLSVLAVYYAVFIALTWLIFNKRDVAA
ncbi:ABC transporter permease [Paenibacillus sp. sptzw28]|uniref:ABC transporter permease n=1 Tax=Paenibacillus sp. sptzw28 TaxID=715179 RepID=UPI001C6E769E|nr:ABC transporter permease [Paenibacillus sp. sptzw28]QYR20597.1 ABC transporter permease [Paenibacillus sp. sptzw28]